ncbi:hypothetical protein IV203_010757 [Nitzschia inconspicua]|uniref:Uncharacterized protein n=1 Tax=Nitzschia inconspicua TaxID=303405 RepID=A0A9K3KXR5_9STRA|nr:hypothetical protein IV203_010757 [Nitzschia inconspicua]
MPPTSSGEELRQADKASVELENRQLSSRDKSKTSRDQHESSSSKRGSSQSVRSTARGQNQEKGCKKPQKPTRKLNDIKIGETEAMNESEISLTLHDLQISSNPSIWNASDSTKDTKSVMRKGGLRRRKRDIPSGNSSALLSHPTHDNSVRSANKERSRSLPAYAGAMVQMVEQMHGSGSTLDYGDSLRISRHSQKQFLDTVLPKIRSDFSHSQNVSSGSLHGSVSSSSMSSFAVASHDEWTGWSSSSTEQQRNSVNADAKIRGLSRATKPSKKGQKRHFPFATTSQPQEVPQGKQKVDSVAETVESTPNMCNTKMRGSSHSTPASRKSKLVPEDFQRMYSSAPCQISNEKVKNRSVLRLKELLANYEVPSVEEEQNKAMKVPLPIISSASNVSPRATLQRFVGNVNSEDATMRQTNRSTDLVDPEAKTEKHANRSHNRTLSKKKEPPPPTSASGYYSPWRAANARRLSVVPSPDKKSVGSTNPGHSTPLTHPLSDTPSSKRPVEANVMLSQIAPPPLSSMCAPTDKLKQEQLASKKRRNRGVL